jgi:uncharacterized protein with NRDE domain
VCLLIALFQVVPGAPLVVAANRDERLDRPAVAMTVLRASGPRILGGRDELAGGTWLAVNEHGLVAGLTNQPSASGRDPDKRSRGELPLAFAAYDSAEEAVAVLRSQIDPAAHNPCWMLVGDRDSLFSVGIAGGSEPVIERLGPGLHVLENAPLPTASAKAEFVRRQVAARIPDTLVADVTVAALEDVLRSHDQAVPQARTDDTGRTWPPEISASCVHTASYGTRSAMTVSVPARGKPQVRVADGRPCDTPFRDVTSLWTEAGSPASGADRLPRRW